MGEDMSPRFPSAWLDELYARADIVQIVNAYVPLKKNGSRYWGLCPFHHEKTPSFSVTPEQNLYYCFGCKAGGNVIQFVQEMEKVSFYEAAKLIAERSHLPLPQVEEDPDWERRKSQRDRLLEANRTAARYYHEMLWTDAGKPVRDYFYKRGLNDSIIRRFGLGASLEPWSDLTEMMEKKGFTREELRLAGLTVVKDNNQYDFFHGRAMFPILDRQGNVLGFGGRIMKDGQPKYLNTGDTPVFNKRMGVYAINLLNKLRNLNRVLLVEGYMDVVSLTQAGIPGVVATLGTSLTVEQARLLKRYAPQIWVAYDGDGAGQTAIERALGIFETEHIDARVLYFPGGQDPDEFIRSQGVEAFNALKPMTPVRYKLMRLEQQGDLSSQEGRIAFAKSAAEIIGKVADPVEIEVYLKELSVKTGFERDVLIAQMGVSRSKLSVSPPQSPKRPPANPAHKQDNEGDKAEQMLVGLLGAGLLPAGMVSEQDFTHPVLKSFAKALLNGKKAAAIVAEAETNQERELAAKVFSADNGSSPENAPAVASDCLRKLRMQRISDKVNEKKDLLSGEADEDAKRRLMTEIITLNTELSRLRQSGH